MVKFNKIKALEVEKAVKAIEIKNPEKMNHINRMVVLIDVINRCLAGYDYDSASKRLEELIQLSK